LFDPEDWESFFAERGWVVESMRFLVEEGERRGRPIPLPWWMRLLTRVVTSERDQVRKMLAFAVLEPTRR
jgi:hypothetical protein